MRFSEAQLETIRTQPSSSKLDLFIFQPRTVMKCLVNNASIARGARTIAFDTVSLGGYASVEAGMTLLVGTTDGAKDVGRIRIKSATSSQFEVAENSNIAWSDNLFLTVLRYWEVWPVFPRIISDPSNDEDVIFYKDYDIAYANQNSILGTLINAGSHRPVLIEGTTGTVYYTSTGTYNLLGESLTYQWAFEGGTPTGSTSAVPGNVYYTTPGEYVTRLKTTSSSGAVDTTYRYVSVKSKIGEGSNTPIQRWSMSSLSGSRGEAGYSAEFEVFDNIALEDNALVMLKSEDWYGASKTSPDGDVLFVGYVEGGSIRYNYRNSSYTFRASSITRLMRESSGFSISVESMGSPSRWFELLDMDAKRAIYHYLRWQSTILSVTDFSYRGHDYKIQYFDADRTSIFDAIDSFLKMTVPGSLCADRQGRLYAEADPQAYSNPTGSFVPVMEITRRDWIGEPNIEERFSDTVSYIELGGIAYSGVYTGTFAAVLSEAPGPTPTTRGTVEKSSGLALQNQDQLNTMIGHIFANKNYRYPTVSMDNAIPVRNLDIAPQEAVLLNIQSADTVRGITLNGLYTPDRISWRYKPETRRLQSTLDLKSLVNGIPGSTLEIPPTPDDSVLGFTSNGFNFGGIKVPSFSKPYPYYPSPTVVNNEHPKVVCGFSSDYGFFYTRNFDVVTPTWYLDNAGFADDDRLYIIKMFVTPSKKVFAWVHDSGLRKVYVLDTVGGTWREIFNAVTLGIDSILDFLFNPNEDEAIAIICEDGTGASNNMLIYTGDSDGVTLTDTIAPAYIGNGAQAVYADGELDIYYNYIFPATDVTRLMRRYWSGGAVDVSVDFSGDYFMSGIANPRGMDRVFLWTNAAKYLTFSERGTVSGVTTIEPDNSTLTTYQDNQQMAFSPSGNFLMGLDHTAGGGGRVPVKSSDGGASWLVASAVIPIGSYIWENCGDDRRFIFGGGATLRYTHDWGESYVEKIGTLLTTAPLINIGGIRYVE